MAPASPLPPFWMHSPMSHPRCLPFIRLSSLASAAALCGLFISSCTTKPPPPPPEPPPGQPKPLYEWPDANKGRKVSHLHVNIDEQKVSVFSGREQIAWATVASGIRSFPTPTGDFTVLEKTASKESNLYGKMYDAAGKCINSDAKLGRDPIPEGGKFEGAKMPYYLRLTGDGIGMHAGPIPRPGSRASHGCIRMPRSFAPILFSHASIGTPVSVTGDGPGYASYIKQQNAKAAKLAADRAKKKAEAEAKALAEGQAAPAPAGAAATPAPAPASTQASTPAPPMKEPKIEIKPAVVPPASTGTEGKTGQ